MRHRPITYTFEDSSGGPLTHVCGVNDIVKSFREGHILTAGRDSKLLEWKLPDNNTAKTTTSTTTTTTTHTVNNAVSSFHVHGDWVNRILTMPNVGFITAGADNALTINTVTESAMEEGGGGGSSSSSSSFKIKDSDGFHHHGGAIKALAWLGNDYSRVALGAADNSISTMGLNEGDKLHQSSVKSMPVSIVGGMNNSCFYVGCMNGAVQTVDIRSRLVVAELIEDAHSSLIRDMLFFKSSHLLVTASSDSLIRAWDIRKNVMDPVLNIDAHGDAVWRLQHVMSGSDGGVGGDLKKGLGWVDESCCFLSGGREGTLHVHDFKNLRTSMLAQCSFPIVSFLAVGSRAYVGTSGTDVLGFNNLLPMSSASSSDDLHSTPVRAKSSSSDLLTPSSIKVDVVAAGGATSSSLLPHEVDSVNASLLSQHQSRGSGHSAAPPPQIGVTSSFLTGPMVDYYTSPFKVVVKQKSDNSNSNNNNVGHNNGSSSSDPRQHPQWASPQTSIARPDTVPQPSVIFQGGVSLIRCTTFPTRLHVAVNQSDGNICVYDIVRCTKVAVLRQGTKFDDVVNLLESLPAMCNSWCTVSCNWGSVTVTMTDSDGTHSNVNGWELSRVTHNFMKKLVAKMEQPQNSNNNNNNNSKTATGGNGFAEQQSVHVHTQEELKTMRALRNFSTWAFHQVVMSAREGRVTRFLVRNLPCHLTDEDKRSLVELPVEELTAVADQAAKAALAEKQQQQGEEATAASATAAAAKPSRCPRWLTALASRPEYTQDKSNHNVQFNCEFHPSPPFGKKLAQAFTDKTQPLQLAKTCLLADLCGFIVKSLKKSNLPTLKEVNAARIAARLPPLYNNLLEETDAGKSRTAEAEEYIYLVSSSGALMDPSITMGVASALFKEKDERVFTIRYAAVL